MTKIKLATRTLGLTESATLALNARAKQMTLEGKTVHNLTAGELATGTPEYIQVSVAKSLEQNKYTPVAGLPELRQKIANEARSFYKKDWITAANVVVTAGGKPALYASLISIVNPGDEVIVPSPWWVSYKHLIELTGGLMVEVPLSSSFDLDVAAITASISSRTKAIIINSPHNPTGAVFSDTALAELAKRLQGTGVTVIADDIYAKLAFENNVTPTGAYDFEHCIIVNGFSKSHALTGWRIGYIIAEQAVVSAATNLLSHVMGNAALPSQHAALSALSHPEPPPVLTQLKAQRELVHERLSAMPKISHTLPGGAFYVFIDLRKITHNSTGWCEDLLTKKGVALVPGEAFGTPGFARLSFVCDEATLVAALDKIQEFVTEGYNK